jgi:broad specificity phosphatase PhoE
MTMSMSVTTVRASVACRLATALVFALLAGCATRSPEAGTHTIIVVRHAEKDDDGTRDPPLSPAGNARAEAIARRLADAPLSAVLATEYLRTQRTGAPAAALHGLEVDVLPGATPADDVADRARGSAGTVLVVGHSNTVPDIVAALCGCAVAPLDESDYDRWFELRPDGHGGHVLRESRY